MLSEIYRDRVKRMGPVFEILLGEIEALENKILKLERNTTEETITPEIPEEE